MEATLLQTLLGLGAGILVIILLTVRYSWHPFFAILLACFVTGFAVGFPVREILDLVKAGFGDIFSKLSLIIVLGTSLGVVLERNGSTQVMADALLRRAGIQRAPLALSWTGFIVGLPIFCDSGYIVLNGINQSLVRRTGITVARMSISLAAGLYAVHCLVPPHPGASAAAISLEVDFGQLLLYGIPIAIPVMFSGYLWASYAGRQDAQPPAPAKTPDTGGAPLKPPAVGKAFLPVLVPIILMSVRSILGWSGMQQGGLAAVLNLLGDPALALATGLLLALLFSTIPGRELAQHAGSGVEKAGAILIIIAAGAAFGAVLSATHIGAHFGRTLDLAAFGIWFPFLVTVLLKTAQGSSTVAVITAASIVVPLLPALGLESTNGRLLTVLAMGAGSMMLSHTNDAYFWVISRFSGIDVRTMLRVHTLASACMGITAILLIYILSLFML